MYRATPISQRDGSALANSNCRMASAATGIDFQSRGAKRSTGAKMRSYTDDQSGGTDASDAKQSWDRGYSESLRIMNGNPWSSAVADLQAGRLVHLDVWHQTVGGPCLSGSGAYGHTMAVAPEQSGSKWLVADPWCSPGKWVWTEAAKLQAGAEEWARRAGTQAGVATKGPWTKDELERVVRAALELMRAWYPGHEAPPGEPPPETGGAQPILYTTTKSQSEEVEPVGPLVKMSEAYDATVRVDGAGHSAIQMGGSKTGNLVELGNGQNLQTFYRGTLAEAYKVGSTTFPVGTAVFGIGTDEAIVFANDVVVATPPTPISPTDCDEALAGRDADWQEWLLAGSPGYQTE